MDELVSVIIPTYRRADKLSRAINSVLNQSYTNIEVIVVDDNNPNDEHRLETEVVMSQYVSCSKVKYIQHEKNKNGSAARNTGFRHSSGEYVLFLDDDDEFLPFKIESQLKCMQEKDASWGACYTRYCIKNTDGRVLRRSDEKRSGDLYLDELGRNLYLCAGSNLMVRRSVMQELNGFDESFRRNQDQEFLTRLLAKYKIAHVPLDGLIVYAHNDLNRPQVAFDEITEQYLHTFEIYINELDEKQQKYVMTVIALQRYRVALLNEQNIKKARFIIKENDISNLTVMRYVGHIIWRKLTKKDYGFKL